MSDFWDQDICNSLGRTFNELHKIIEDQKRQIDLLKGWEKIAHVNGDQKRIIIEKINKLIEEIDRYNGYDDIRFLKDILK